MALTKRKSYFKVIIRYIGGLILLSIIIYIGGKKALKNILQPDWVYLFFTFITMIAIFVVGSTRWGYIINVLKNDKVCSYFDYFYYFVSGRFFGQYVSTVVGDFLLRPAALKKSKNINLKTGISTSLLDKLLDFLFILILIVPSLLYLFNIISSTVAIIVIIMLFLFICYFFIYRNHLFIRLFKRTLTVMINIIKKIKFIKFQEQRKYTRTIRKLGNFKLLQKKALYMLISITVIKYIVLVLRIYFLSLALNLSIPLFILFIGIPIAQLSLILGITPGALGVLEGGWFIILSMKQISQVNIVSFLIGQRAYWYIFTCLIFLSAYIVSFIMKLKTGDADK